MCARGGNEPAEVNGGNVAVGRISAGIGTRLKLGFDPESEMEMQAREDQKN